MVGVKEVVESIFSAAFFINALFFIPQALRLFKEKDAKGVSIITFLGFLFIQLVVVLHVLVIHDYFLLYTYLFSMVTCGIVVVLIVMYSKSSQNDTNGLSLEDVMAQLPEHVYWKDKNFNLLGCNTESWKDLGLKSYADYQGKNDYDFLPKDQADHIRAVDTEVVQTGKMKIIEEFSAKADGTKALYLSHKLPLKNKQGQIVGVVGISVDITHAKQQVEDQLDMLENIIAVMPGHVYWVDKEGRYLGCNDNQAQSAGLSLRKEIVGKRNQDLPWNSDAGALPEELDSVNKEVMGKGIIKVLEEPATLKDGRKIMFLSSKAPLRNSRNEVTGMVGISLDVTDRKDKEQLQRDMEINKKLLEAREKFKLTAQQVAHDINSPLGGLMMIIANLDPKKPISEKERLDIKEALNEIRIVADELVNYDKIEADPETHKKDKPLPLPISVILAQFLAVKQSEYKNLSITLSADISEKAYAAFIKMEPTALKRSLSNIINNARDAFDGQPGKILLKLTATKTQVKISIEDNGKGMSPEVVEKIMHKIAVTSDKAAGHGFGMVQVSEALARNRAKLKVESVVGQGTTVILTFPRIETAFWFAEQITMGPHDIIVVLDDDATMHHGWSARLKDILAKYPGLRLEHFYEGAQAIEFINAAVDKQKILLLTDYELSGQMLNGLDVVAQTKVQRSFLVTSHYEKPDIQGRAIDLDVKIIPKQSATTIPIKVDVGFAYAALVQDTENKPLKKVDIIVVDDNETFAQLLVLSFEAIDKVAEVYTDPRKLLKEVTQYSKDTRICMDNDFGGNGQMSGVDLAKSLHALGYSQLYLLSGSTFAPGELPEYLTAVVKSDADFAQKIFNQS